MLHPRAELPGVDEALRRAEYQTTLLGNVLPFWTEHAIDTEFGGYLTSLDRTGQVYDTDKPVWILGRFAWTLARVALGFRDDPNAGLWTRAARAGVDFSERHAFDADGQMYFLLSREGRPLRKRRYVFSEGYAAMAAATTARAEREILGVDDGGDLFRRALAIYRGGQHRAQDGSLPPKIDMKTRPLRGMGFPMITLNVIQNLRDTVPSDIVRNEGLDLDLEAQARITDIAVHLKPERRIFFETLGQDGAILEHCVEGRTLTPGNAFETAWFILVEAQHAGLDTDAGRRLVLLACDILDWTWPLAWDSEYGGIFYLRDSAGHPVQDLAHDMKLWWPHNEAEIATLLAFKLTGEARYATWYGLVHDYAWAAFSDRQHGEWFAALARDGRPVSVAKGNHFKGPFHLPRMLLVCHDILKDH